MADILSLARFGFVVVVCGLLMVPEIFGEDPAPSPPTPEASTPSGEAAPTAADPAALADQVRQLADMNRKLMEQLGDLSSKYEDLNRKVEASTARQANSGASAPATSGVPSTSTGGPARRDTTSRDAGLPRAGGGSGGGVRNTGSSQGVGNRRLGKIPIKPSYDYDRGGFLLETVDSEFQLKVRGLIQTDIRIFEQSHQNPVVNGFSAPRVRWYFSGRLTKPLEYQLSIQDSFGVPALLNAYVDYNYDERLQLRVGRFKTPFTYEYYKISAYDLFAPERSLYNVNFQGNRQVGLMLWGELFKRRVEYAVGTFDGGRNTYQPFNNNQDVMAFFNFKPFLQEQDSPLQDLNFGGSLDYGSENNFINPVVLRTTQQATTASLTSTSGANTSSVPFLAFNNNVTERGIRSQYELHLAYYYKALAVLAAWDSGSDSYATTTKGSGPVSIPTGGYSVQAAYLLTGETRNDFGVIDPLRPFDLRAGHFGLGAFEPTARYSTIALGRQVFDAGLADRNLWTNSASMTDVGFNWYLNKVSKIYFDWNHAEFGQPVYYAPGKLQKTADLYWFRFQLYF